MIGQSLDGIRPLAKQWKHGVKAESTRDEFLHRCVIGNLRARDSARDVIEAGRDIDGAVFRLSESNAELAKHGQRTLVTTKQRIFECGAELGQARVRGVDVDTE